MRRLLPLVSLVLLGGCGASAPPPPAEIPAAQREVTARMTALGKEIDELNQRYEGLLKQNAAIEKLLAQLGFSAQMTADTVAQRVELMRRFERAEAARTAAYEKLRGLLKTLASQHKTDMQVEVRGGQIVVRLAEAGLFDPKKGRLRAEATPLLWAIAEGLKEFTGRGFEVVAAVTPPAPEPPAAPGKRKPGRKPKAAKVEDPWAAAAGRAAEVVRTLEGAGIAAERLAAVERLAAAGAARAIEIVVLPTREELPRVHGAEDSSWALPEKAPAPAPPTPASKTPAPAGRQRQ